MVKNYAFCITMKAKLVIRGLFFLSVFFAGLFYLNKVFASKERYVNTAHSFRQISAHTNIDVILLGSSHVYTAINPEVINKECKTISFNLGSDGLRFQFSSMILEEALKYSKPKLVVVEVFRGSVLDIETEVSKGFQLRAMDYVSNFSARKWALTRAHYDFDEITGVYSPLIRNHQNWSEVDYLNLDRRDQLETQYTTFYDGFLGSFNNLSPALLAKYKGFASKPVFRDTSYTYIKPEHITEFERLVALSKKHDFELLVLTNPDLRATSMNRHFYDQLDYFSKQFGLPYLNFNYQYDALDITTEDFKDASHLNYFGAHKTSLALSRYINENYNLPDKLEDPYWQTKTSNYNEYLSIINGGKVLYQESLNDTLHKQITLNNLTIQQSKLGMVFTLDFDAAGIEANDQFKIGVQVYPRAESIDQLGEFSVKAGRKFDNTSAIIKDLSETLTLNIKTRIKDVDRIRFFIFDKDGYKGTLGKPLIISGKSLLTN